MSGKHAIRAALCAGMLTVGAGSAGALELKDLIIEFDVIHETVTTFRHQPSKWSVRINAIAGKLVWHGWACGALVYQTGAHSETVNCPVERSGTAKHWSERGGTATYNTNMTVAGNLVTLQGKMTGRETSSHNYCGRRGSKETLADVTQSLRIRITGKTCQVLQFSEVQVTTERETFDSDGGELKTEIATHTLRLVPNAKCTVRRRSEEPIRPPGGLVNVTGNC